MEMYWIMMILFLVLIAKMINTITNVALLYETTEECLIGVEIVTE